MLLKTNQEYLKQAISIEKARRTFKEFVVQAWPLVEPAMPLRPGWHIDAICDHLQAVSDGHIQRLLVNIPPGLGKSILVSVLWPAWVWARRPGWRSIFSSYSHDLVVRDATRSRALMNEPWYQEAFVRGEWEFSSDMNRKDMYTNTATGRRISISVGSQATGYRGNCVAVDDPLNVSASSSEISRKEVLTWWDQAMQTRVDDPVKDSFVVIMQRLHEEDLSGHILEMGGYEHLCLPAEFETSRKCVTYIKRDGKQEKFFEDPRTVEGQILFPDLHPKEVLDKRKKELGSTGFAGQFQQRPASASGGMFRYSWWKFWRYTTHSPGSLPRDKHYNQEPARILPDKFHQIIGSVDAAFKGKEESDYVVATVWGVVGQDWYLIDMVRAKMEFEDTCKVLKNLSQKHSKCRRWLVEDKANGPAIVNTLRATIPGIMALSPEGGKEARASAIQPAVEAGQVFLPDGVEWVGAFIEEFALFPNAKHDDQVDSTSQAMVYIMANPNVLRAMMLVQNMI